MNSFAIGILTACLLTTNEGREITCKTGKIITKIGQKYINEKIGIDVTTLLKEETVKENEKKEE